MTSPLTIAVFTGSRSEFDRLYHVCEAIERHPDCTLRLIAANAHFSPEQGMTVSLIEESGLPIAERVEMLLASGSAGGMLKSVGLGCIGLADALERISPDAVVVLGDRFELLSVAAACVCLSLPLAHIGGGQETFGAIDNTIRHLVSKAAHLHFVAHASCERTLLAMGEEAWRIHVTGSPSIDHLVRTTGVDKKTLGERLGLDLERPTALVAYHPTTMLDQAAQRRLDEAFFAALAAEPLQYVLTYPNVDPGSREIIDKLHALEASHDRPCALVPTLGRELFVSALRHLDVMIGNSSSGLVEAPACGMPAVDVGDRQDQRLRGDNVYHCPGETGAIREALANALRHGAGPMESPYGDGDSARRIADILAAALRETGRTHILTKRFAAGENA